MPKPAKCVNVEEARKLQDDWKASRAKEIERGQGYQDTREFWYSLDELQEYLDYVKEKSAEQGVKKAGIRIYFGAYPKANGNKSYATVFLAPTKEAAAEGIEGSGSDANNYDIDPLNEGTGGNPPSNY